VLLLETFIIGVLSAFAEGALRQDDLENPEV